MDGVHFDSLTKRLGARRASRAHLLGGLAALATTLLGMAHLPWLPVAVAKKKRRRKRTLCHCPDTNPQNCTTVKVARRGLRHHLNQHPNDFLGACAKSPKKPKKPKKPKAPKPTPSCTDGLKNGEETGVDCGGPCALCANGQGCKSRGDCAGALCKNHTCQACTASPECGSDAAGPCACVQPEGSGPTVCAKGTPTDTGVASCPACAEGTLCVAGAAAGSFDCFLLCGAP
jgi:hypothetical protein